MTTHVLDATGLKCPGPTLKITSMLFSVAPGDILEVSADCPTFEADLKAWCQRNNKLLLFILPAGHGKMKAQIRF